MPLGPSSPTRTTAAAKAALEKGEAGIQLRIVAQAMPGMPLPSNFRYFDGKSLSF
jgi:hypothetical protein